MTILSIGPHGYRDCTLQLNHLIILQMETNIKAITSRTIPLFGLLLIYSSLSFAEIHATVTATTDYVSRGYSKSDEGFAIQANLDYEHSSGFFLGTSVSNVDFGDNGFDDPSNVEIIPYLGWSFNLSDDFRLDMQWTRYLYDGKIYGRQSDYNEYYALLHYRDIFSARASFSENFYNQGSTSSDYELTGRYPITDTVELSTGVGYSFTKDILEYDYLYWNAGMTYFTEFVAFDFRYLHAIDTSVNENVDWPYEPKVSNPSFVFQSLLD